MTPDEFLRSYTELVGWMRSRILAATNPDNLLDLASFYGEIRQANFDGIYSDDEVENHVAQNVLAACKFEPSAPKSGPSTILIASELYDAGGHSRVVRNWLKSFRGDGSHSLLVTRWMTKGFKGFLQENGIPYHTCTGRGTGRVREIVNYCASAQRIVLLIHPDDIVSAVGSRHLGKTGRQIIFYNHADHGFSFGLSYSDVVGEISSYGVALNRRTKRAKKSCYLGIPIDVGTRSNPSEERGQVVLTCGASYKYRPATRFFGDFIDKLFIEKPEAIVELVGPTGTEPWWKDRIGRWSNRVRFLGELPHAQYMEAMTRAAVYVDSFPIPGGTALPEALLNGKQVVGLQNPLQGYTPADELRVDTIDGLVERVANLLDADAGAKESIKSSRIKAREAHSLSAFRDRVLALYNGKCEACPWQESVSVDTYSLETEWKADRVILGLGGPRIFYVPFSFLVTYLSKIYRLHESPRYKFFAFALSRIILRILPAPLRTYTNKASFSLAQRWFNHGYRKAAA